LRRGVRLRSSAAGNSGPDSLSKMSAMTTMLVTGASSGVGAAIVKHYTKKGFKVAAVARGEEKLKAVCAEAGAGAVAFPCDVSKQPEVAKTVEAVLAEFGSIDVLINNAAVPHDNVHFWELDVSAVDSCIDINAKGTMYVTHAVLQSMIPKNAGRIFAIASVASTWGIPTESCYVASKHAMLGFMDSLANETRSTNIVVSTICPGGIDTPWWKPDHPYGSDQTHVDRTTDMLIQSEEIIGLLDYQMTLPTNRVLKRVIFFPKGEWH